MFGLSPSWINEPTGYDPLVNGHLEQMANAISPTVEMQNSAAVLKRKREITPDAPGEQNEAAASRETKRWKSNVLNGDLPTPKASPPAHPCTDVPVVPATRIQETIETQLGLEILLKHKELRLINQELAKCQVALEQLRRCHLIPYPVSQGTSQSRMDVMNGTGPAVSQRGSVPQWAPAFGVTDGPYSRHYSKWLIPDPSFDGEQVEWYRTSELSRAGKTIPEGRATRHSFAEGSTAASKSRSQRGSTGQKLHALSNGYPQAKEKAGPCILKRADGQMVKLVCIDCKRDNFSSTQGFINHCRIAHRRDFKSHEEAAVASGQAIEVDEVGSIVGEEKTPTVATGLVHPMIRTAPSDNNAYRALLSRIETSMNMYRQGKLPGVTSIPKVSPSAPSVKAESLNKFVPSLDTPHLSNLMKMKGFGGNLTDIVSDAKKISPEFNDSSHDEESDIESPGQQPREMSNSHPPPMRMPARAAMSPVPFGRPGSSKGVEVHARVPSGISPRLSHALSSFNATPMVPPSRPSTHLNIHTPSQIAMPERRDMDIDMMHGPSIHDLSPNTVASNNAPSLVSDDGEYEDGDDVESVTSASDHGSDVAEISIEDGVEKVVARAVMRKGNEGLRKDENKHVTFVTPVSETGKDRR
ncbi:hypothetical protein HYALB_00010362 [Hymenoscyphus albidus]|uniref:AHC1-like C2H2 zinc-finger domain-containing protein n=1 Tax=Hymenoscyphus albidus TaxID=595503 RepID=A0A9N9LLQ7_9HELO|nr:hypothetical protein HYALB_00010362 [Hymenoscyphus albidus]